MQIKIKYFSEDAPKLTYIGGEDKSNWIDLYAAEDVRMRKGQQKLIPLGVAMELPEGYEAHIVPRSSTCKRFGIIQQNHMGVIDSSYKGPNDQWMFGAIAVRRTKIKAGDRICQFRIVEKQPHIEFVEDSLENNEDSGGSGSTGV